MVSGLTSMPWCAACVASALRCITPCGASYRLFLMCAQKVYNKPLPARDGPCRMAQAVRRGKIPRDRWSGDEAKPFDGAEMGSEHGPVLVGLCSGIGRMPAGGRSAHSSAHGNARDRDPDGRAHFRAYHSPRRQQRRPRPRRRPPRRYRLPPSPVRSTNGVSCPRGRLLSPLCAIPIGLWALPTRW